MLGKLFKFGEILLLLGLIAGVVSVAVLGREGVDKIVNYFNEDENYEAESFTSTEEVDKINLQCVNRNVKVIRAEIDHVQIDYFVSDKDPIEVSESNGEIIMTNKVRWRVFSVFRYVSTEKRTVSVTLPNDLVLDVEIETTNGSIGLENLADVKSVLLESTNGSITVKGVNSLQDIEVETVNGGLNVQNVTANKIILETTNGGITVFEATSDDIRLQSTNGGMNVNISGNFENYRVNVRTTNGRIRFGDLVVASGIMNPNAEKNLEIKTTNGSVDLSFK